MTPRVLSNLKLIGVVVVVMVSLLSVFHPGLQAERVLARGDREVIQGRLESSLPFYQRARELDPDSYRPHFRLGKTLLSLNRLESAEPHLVRAADLAPDETEVQLNLAYLRVLQNRPAKAWFWIKRALQEEPQLQEALILAAATGRSKTWYRKVLEVNPHQLMTRLSLADVLVSEGRGEAALELYRGSLRRESGANLEVYTRMGDGLRLLGRFEEAAESYRNALALNEFHGPAQFGLGLVLMNSDPSEARRHFELFLKLMPGDSRVPVAQRALEILPK